MPRPFKEVLSSGEFVITSEIGPPKGTNIEKMVHHIELLRDKVHGMNVTDNQSSVMRLSSVAVCHIIKDHGGEPILQMTCRDRNRMALQSDLLSAYVLGVRNVLCLTGDHISLGDHKGAKQVFDLDSVQLIKAVRTLEQGNDLGGNKLDGAVEFCVGGTATPEADRMDSQLLKFRKKIRAGAEFFQTQAVYDMGKIKEFMTHAGESKVLAGILVITSAGMAKYLNANVAGVTVPQGLIDEMVGAEKGRALQKGMEIAARQIKQIRDEKICHGVHIMAIGREEIVPEILEMIEEEMQEEDCPGFKLPIDKSGADFAFFPNSKEIAVDSDDMKWYWKIFYAAKADWTIPRNNWEAVDWGLFTGNDEASMTIARRKIDFVKKHNIKRMILPDCGGGSFGCRSVIEKWKAKDSSLSVDYLYIYEIIMEYMKEGRIKVDKSKNTKLHTWHDSCKHGREAERLFGKGMYDEPRWILSQCTDNIVEMYPTGPNSFCCGAGGGMWPGPYKEELTYNGAKKVESIKNSGAEVVVTGCSNCRDQIMKNLKTKYNLDIEVKYIWQLVAESLVL